MSLVVFHEFVLHPLQEGCQHCLIGCIQVHHGYNVLPWQWHRFYIGVGLNSILNVRKSDKSNVIVIIDYFFKNVVDLQRSCQSNSSLQVLMSVLTGSALLFVSGTRTLFPKPCPETSISVIRLLEPKAEMKGTILSLNLLLGPPAKCNTSNGHAVWLISWINVWIVWSRLPDDCNGQNLVL